MMQGRIQLRHGNTSPVRVSSNREVPGNAPTGRETGSVEAAAAVWRASLIVATTTKAMATIRASGINARFTSSYRLPA